LITSSSGFSTSGGAAAVKIHDPWVAANINDLESDLRVCLYKKAAVNRLKVQTCIVSARAMYPQVKTKWLTFLLRNTWFVR
jgi:hypothetical protein